MWPTTPRARTWSRSIRATYGFSVFQEMGSDVFSEPHRKNIAKGVSQVRVCGQQNHWVHTYRDALQGTGSCDPRG